MASTSSAAVAEATSTTVNDPETAAYSRVAAITDEGRDNPQICFGFDGLEPGGAYTLSVEEDAAAEDAAGPRKTYKGAETADAADFTRCGAPPT